jgi:hypothetical protein
MLSSNMIISLHLRSLDRFKAVSYFAPRVLVVLASLVRLILLNPVTRDKSPEYRLWLPAIISQVHVSLSICTACIPYIVPVPGSLYGNRCKTSLSTPTEQGTYERHTRKQSTLWLRRQKKLKTSKSWDGHTVTGLQYLHSSIRDQELQILDCCCHLLATRKTILAVVLVWLRQTSPMASASVFLNTTRLFHEQQILQVLRLPAHSHYRRLVHHFYQCTHWYPRRTT